VEYVTHAALEEWLNALDIHDWNELGNARSAIDAWIKQMGMPNEAVTYECFHIVDESWKSSSQYCA